jgi:hypothetical protein
LVSRRIASFGRQKQEPSPDHNECESREDGVFCFGPREKKPNGHKEGVLSREARLENARPEDAAHPMPEMMVLKTC